MRNGSGLAGEGLSAHIHFDGQTYGPAGDRVLLDVVEPFVTEALSSGWIDRFFFVRYVRDGQQLRLRLRGDTGTLACVVKPALAKHAGTGKVDVYAEVSPESVEVFVKDRGVGFDPATIATDRHGVRGSIIDRMERHGGSAEVRSTPGEGTEVVLRMPVQEEKQ